MKSVRRLATLFALVLLSLASEISQLAQAATPQLRLELGAVTNRLVLGPISDPGALFIFQADDLSSFFGAAGPIPSVIFQTNTPLASSLGLPMTINRSTAAQGFFLAAHWPNRSVTEFGDPEYLAPQGPPAMVLITSGLPPRLSTGTALVADFFVTDPAGDLLDLSRPVQIYVVRPLDGAIHPDAVVTPSDQPLLGGHFRAQLRLQAAISLAGYTLGLVLTNTAASAQPLLLAPVVNLGPSPLTNPTAAALRQALVQLRQSATDSESTWSLPLPVGTPFDVIGVFGEWRGKDNLAVHRGVDLAPTGQATILASRGGIISSLGVIAGWGAYVVIDHGTGWFSRYAGLDENALLVASGQTIARGAPLCTRLSGQVGEPPRLHFEIRHTPNQPQWDVAIPGLAGDPLQTPGAIPIPAGTRAPQLEVVGVTRRPPGQYAFKKSSPDPNWPARPVYVFTRFADPEPDQSGAIHRLGPRWLSFQPEGASAPTVIQPSDDTVIAQLLPPGTGSVMGFTQYGPLHAAIPDPLNWYEYWWSWDTSNYTNDPKGSRTIQLTGQTVGGLQTNYILSFGPEIKQVTWKPPGSGQYQVTLAAHLGSDLGGSQLIQPDQYHLEVLQADRSPMPGVHWLDTAPGDITQILFTNLQEVTYSFTLSPTQVVAPMIVRASSLMAPDLRHEVTQGALLPPLVAIPAGTFLMGSPTSEVLRESWEGPPTLVTFTYSFKMGQYEVTQGQYLALMATNPAYFSGDLSHPVDQVSWDDAMAYCERLTIFAQQAGLLPTNWAYRLPTEAEWEYACRAGAATAFSYGPALRSGMANFDGIYEYDSALGEVRNPDGIHLWGSTPVGSYAPNAWGIFDMHGNAWEWCLDGWTFALPGGSVTNLLISPSGADRTIRGGCWSNNAQFCRSAYRFRSPPGNRSNVLGFRVVLAPTSP